MQLHDVPSSPFLSHTASPHWDICQSGAKISYPHHDLALCNPLPTQQNKDLAANSTPANPRGKSTHSQGPWGPMLSARVPTLPLSQPRLFWESQTSAMPTNTLSTLILPCLALGGFIESSVSVFVPSRVSWLASVQLSILLHLSVVTLRQALCLYPQQVPSKWQWKEQFAHTSSLETPGKLDLERGRDLPRAS